MRHFWELLHEWSWFDESVLLRESELRFILLDSAMLWRVLIRVRTRTPEVFPRTFCKIWSLISLHSKRNMWCMLYSGEWLGIWIAQNLREVVLPGANKSRGIVHAALHEVKLWLPSPQACAGFNALGSFQDRHVFNAFLGHVWRSHLRGFHINQWGLTNIFISLLDGVV